MDHQPTHSDCPSYAVLRERMVRDQLARRGVCDEAVLNAMGRIAREAFVPPGLRKDAYEDRALPVDCGQTISQPYMVAQMTEWLAVKADDRVLEIGTGTGYQTAVLAMLGARVYTIERHEPLSRAARERLAAMGLTRVEYRVGDGSMGWSEAALFDGIVVTAGAPDVPEALRGQLAAGGRLVAPVGGLDSQTLVRITRTVGGFDQENLLACRFVKLVGEGGWAEQM